MSEGCAGGEVDSNDWEIVVVAVAELPRARVCEKIR